jgi:hypothetical protein
MVHTFQYEISLPKIEVKLDLQTCYTSFSPELNELFNEVMFTYVNYVCNMAAAKKFLWARKIYKVKQVDIKRR